jgi:ribosome maturation factor RimP
MSSSFLNQIRKMAEEVAAREGCYLYDLEMVGAGGGRVLRVTIDREGDGGVSIVDCSNVSRGLNLLLDVEDVIPGGQYNLEVSSPGLERVLKEARHFQRAIGQKVSVKTFAPLLQFNEHLAPLAKAKQIQGTLLSFDERGIKVSAESFASAFASASFRSAASLSEPLSGLSESGEGFEKAEDSEAVDHKILEPKKDEGNFSLPEVFIPFETVTKAHVVYEFPEPGEKKNVKGPKKGKGKNKRG